MSFVTFNWIPILLPFFIAVLNYRRLDSTLRILFYFVAYGTANEVLGFVLRTFWGQQNSMPAGNIYFIAEFILLGLFYRKLLADRFSPKLVLGLIILVGLAFVGNLTFFQTFYEYPSLLSSVSKFIFIIFAILYFYRVMDEARIGNLWKEPMIYVNTAVLVYYAGNLFFSLMFNVILEFSREFLKLAGIYFSFLNAVFYVLIALGFRLAILASKKLLA